MRATLLLVILGSIAVASQGAYVMNQAKAKSLDESMAAKIELAQEATNSQSKEGPPVAPEPPLSNA